ncbi:MAG: protein kinase, partial [Cyanobacteria bacterium P01_D01_bin.128]
MQTVRASGSLIQDRYRIVKMLGQGGSGTTYQAQDCLTGYYVALKELSLKGLKDWKQLELFEREAQVLAGLDHPAIPNYVDYFQVDFDNDRCFYIVQALAAGHSLANLVAEGVHFSEADARYIASEILQILDYLHSLNPPI